MRLLIFSCVLVKTIFLEAAMLKGIGDFTIGLLEANSGIMHALLFKIRKNRASLKHGFGKVTINETVLGSVRVKIKAKLADRAGDYIDSVNI